MYRLFVGACVLAVAALVCQPADDAKAETPDEMWTELVAKFQAATSQDARKEILETYGKQFLDYEKKNAKTENGAKALGYALQLPGRGKDSPRAKALEIVKKDYLRDKAIRPIVGKLVQGGDENYKLVKSVLADNPDKATRAAACIALGRSHESALQMPKMLKANKELREQYEKEVGKEAVQKELDKIEPNEKALKGFIKTLRSEYKGLGTDLFVGAVAPEVVSETLDGKKVKLSDLKGKVVVLDVWATWCPPCRAMIPHSTKLVDKLKDKPFVLVGISVDKSKDIVLDFKKKTKMPWTHWYNGPSGGIVKDWDINSYPTIYVLDAKGVIREKDVRGEAMDEVVEKLLKELEEEKKTKTE